MLDRVTIERLMAAAGAGPVLIALSGGGDSTALLHVLAESVGAPRLSAAIVDHGLRAGSADDARRAADFAGALGVQATVLTLTWPPEANRGQQAARRARYAALCAHARVIGAQVIAAAHTADDQAETVLMRAAGGSSWRGLAGMAALAAAPIWPEGRGLLLARPLLGARRVALRDLLRQRGADWIEDPANANPAFERVRVRARLVELEAGGFDPLRLVRLAERLRPRVDALDRAAWALIETATTVDRDARIVRAAWQGPDDVRRRALAVLMAAVAGAEREAPLSVMRELEVRVWGAGYLGGTHSGVAFTPKAETLQLARDPGAALGRADGAAGPAPLPLPLEQEVVWDGRLALTAREPGWRAVADANPALVAVEKGAEKRRLDQAGGGVAVRALAPERVRHAFASQVNGTQRR